MSLASSRWFYCILLYLLHRNQKIKFQIRSIEKMLEWLVAMVANYLEHYIYLCSPRPLYEIEI